MRGAFFSANDYPGCSSLLSEIKIKISGEMSPLCAMALVGIAAWVAEVLVSRGSQDRGKGGCRLPRCPHRLSRYGSKGGSPEGCGVGPPSVLSVGSGRRSLGLQTNQLQE